MDLHSSTTTVKDKTHKRIIHATSPQLRIVLCDQQNRSLRRALSGIEFRFRLFESGWTIMHPLADEYDESRDQALVAEARAPGQSHPLAAKRFWLAGS
jgi:hypothetical protein